MKTKKVVGKRLRCPRKNCGHVWTYRGIRTFYTICPNCHGSVHVVRDVVKQEMPEEKASS